MRAPAVDYNSQRALPGVCDHPASAAVSPRLSRKVDRNRRGINSAQKGESHMFPRASRFFAALAACFVLPGMLAAQAVTHWYQPHYLSSVEEASNRMTFLAPHFSPMYFNANTFSQTSGYRLEHVDVNKLGLNLSFTKSGVVQSSEYFWSWTGGYNAPVSTPYTDDIVTSIVYSEIQYFNLWTWPKVKNLATPWCVVPVVKSTPRNDILCVPTEQDAHDLVDALATLAVASGTMPDGTISTTFGMTVAQVPEKELKRHPEQSGCLVKDLELDGPPQLAGLKDGDIVHTVDGKPCIPTGPGSFGYAIFADTNGKPAGGVVHVEVFRKDQLMPFDLHYPNSEVDVKKLEQSAADLAQKNSAPAAAPAGAPPAGVRLGIQVRAVTDADVTPMGLAKARGIVVVDVEKDSLAAKMGLLPGDVILEVNNSEIGDLDLFIQFVRSGAVKKFKVWRKGQSLDLVVPQSL